MTLPTDFDQVLTDARACQCPACRHRMMVPIALRDIDRSQANPNEEASSPSRSYWYCFECGHEELGSIF
jgi:hypothetical protein